MSAASPAAIALVDCVSFYASCERVFDASLVARPVVVLSNNDGCIIARSPEVRRIPELKMGTPIFRVEHVVDAHDVAVFSSNYSLYGDMSLRVMEALQEFTPEVEVYSIDEALLGLDRRPHQSFLDYGLEIREKVRRWTGIPTSVGISQTKTLAKVAQRFSKKRSDATAQGVLDLTRSLHPSAGARRDSRGGGLGCWTSLCQTAQDGGDDDGTQTS